MDQFGWLGWVIIGALAGWLGCIVMGSNVRQELLLNVVVGIIGGVIGGYVFNILPVPALTGFQVGSLATAFVGAIILIGVTYLGTGRRSDKPRY